MGEFHIVTFLGGQALVDGNHKRTLLKKFKEGAEDYILDMPGRINVIYHEISTIEEMVKIFRKLNAGKHLRPLDIRRAYPSALREGIEEYYSIQRK